VQAAYLRALSSSAGSTGPTQPSPELLNIVRTCFWFEQKALGVGPVEPAEELQARR